MTSFLSRRRLFRHATAVVGLGLLASEAPRAAAQAASPLPAIGQTIGLSLNAFGVTLFVDQPPPLPTLNFIGSAVVKVLVGGSTFVRLQTLAFTMEAHHQLFGRVTLTLPDIDVSPASILSVAGPDELVHTWLQSMNSTFERFGDAEGPFTYTTLEPAKFVANLTHFPPPPQGMNQDGSPTGGHVYGLQAPIKLGTPSSTGVVHAELRGMNLNVGQL